MNTVIAEFCHRVERIPFHGIGLSADVYQPDFLDVMACLEQSGCAPDFVELFRASTSMLAAIRDRYPTLPMPYHAEGLWLTQPAWSEAAATSVDLKLAAEQVRALDSAWFNNECAGKMVGGYPVGTYLPPLFTAASARLVARHSCVAQALLDRLAGAQERPGPLLLLELPPLTYFGLGDLPVSRFFARIAEEASCGFVLDIGHLWTHYRYGRREPGESLDRFVGRFLDEFPLERVVEIHVAGLAPHPSIVAAGEQELPLWLDAHGERIPAVLFEMLDQVLTHPGLHTLKGLALEVDTKQAPVIAEEFALFRQRYAHLMERRRGGPAVIPREGWAGGVALRHSETLDATALDQAYRDYAGLVTGRGSSQSTPCVNEADSPFISLYRESYLPHEVLRWGGDLAEMFPQTCAHLARRGLALEEFVSYWFAHPRQIPEPFDFFLLKIHWFVEFVREKLPDAGESAEREADELRAAYEIANDPAPVPAGSRT